MILQIATTWKNVCTIKKIVEVYVQDKSETRRARIYIRQTEVESSTVYSKIRKSVFGYMYIASIIEITWFHCYVSINAQVDTRSCMYGVISFLCDFPVKMDNL